MNRQAAPRSFFIACLIGWLAICSTAAVYGRAGNIPPWLGIPLVAAFLVEFAFYLIPGFEELRDLLTRHFSRAALAPILAASAVAPYLVFSLATGQFRARAFLTLLAIAAAVSIWFVFFPASTFADFAFLLFLAAIVLEKPFKHIYLSPIPRMEVYLHGLNIRIPPDFLGHMMIIRLGASALLLQRRFAGLRFGFMPSLRESMVGLRFFLYFLPVGIPLGWWLGVTMRGKPQPAWLALGVFFGVLWVVALSEEFAFRGILQQGIANLTGSPIWALVIASVLFGLCHLPFRGFPNYRMAALAAVAGGFYGQAFREGGVRASMVAHALVVTTWLVWLK